MHPPNKKSRDSMMTNHSYAMRNATCLDGWGTYHHPHHEYGTKQKGTALL